MPGPSSVRKVIGVTYRIVIVDVLVLVALYYVLQDLQWRTNYAASLHTACASLCGYSPSYGFSFMIRYLTMNGNSQHLVSPPALDWVQVLVFLLVVANGWFAYGVLKARRSHAATQMPTQPAT